jgi:hypothetical protein
MKALPLIPAKAGIQFFVVLDCTLLGQAEHGQDWIPAFAGMSGMGDV